MEQSSINLSKEFKSGITGLFKDLLSSIPVEDTIGLLQQVRDSCKGDEDVYYCSRTFYEALTEVRDIEGKAQRTCEEEYPRIIDEYVLSFPLSMFVKEFRLLSEQSEDIAKDVYMKLSTFVENLTNLYNEDIDRYLKSIGIFPTSQEQKNVSEADDVTEDHEIELNPIY